MRVKLVADSSANLNTMEGYDFASAAMKIVTAEKEYVDTQALDVKEMLHDLQIYKGKSGTACPGVGEWTEAFDDADMVLGVAITSNLSGSYNSGRLAAEQYMEEHPDRKAFILDSLSTGPEMELILEKYGELVEKGLPFEDICEQIQKYHQSTHLYFSLESVSNLAKNGRVSPVVAAAVGLMGIRIVGKASASGTLETLHKCRGEKKAVKKIYACMKEAGFAGGKVRIGHTYNDEAVESLTALIRADFPDCDIRTRYNRGLCCFYAEEGGFLIGFEG